MPADSQAPTEETHVFEADVSRLLHLMVHSVYSDKDVFLRELISNAADACEKLRYESLATPDLLGQDPKLRIEIRLDPGNGKLTVVDNGIGMTRDEMVDALGTIARSGTKAFMERLEAAQSGESARLIGQFGVGFYATFMVADKVDVISRRAGSPKAFLWSSDGKGSYTISEAPLSDAPQRGTAVIVHLMADAKTYADRFTVERAVRASSGHVPVPIFLLDKPDGEAEEIADGGALWAKPKSEIKPEDYTDFYRSLSGHLDEPALTLHFKAEGRQDYTALAFIPSAKPFDLFDPGRKGRIKLYVRRVLISDEAEILPGYLRFVRGLVDSADLPLNMSREMIQESPLLASIRKGLAGRVLSELEKLAASDGDAYSKIWENFGAVLKEGLYEDYERRDALLGLARFKTTRSGETWRSLKDYVAGLKDHQTAIYYIAGEDTRIAGSPHLEGFRARGVEVLLLSDPVDSFWVTSVTGFDGKPFKSVTQGAADLAAIPLADAFKEDPSPAPSPAMESFLSFAKELLAEHVADVRVSARLTDSAVCLVAAEHGMDRRLEKILAGAGRLDSQQKPILEVNPRHPVVAGLATKRQAGADADLVADGTRLLLDEARILDGEGPLDPNGFAQRLSRVMAKGLLGSSDRP